MKHRNLVRSLIALVLCITAVTAGITAAAYEKTLSCSYRKITQDGFVADVYNGVEARYNLYGRTLYCTELIERYCREYLGVEVRIGGAAPIACTDGEHWFEEVAEAQPGDILYGSAAARGKGYNHWAICKSVNESAGTMTLFEQNWRWNGCAGVDRVIPLQDSCYRAFRLMPEPEEPEETAEVAEAAQTAESAVYSSPLLRYALDAMDETAVF